MSLSRRVRAPLATLLIATTVSSQAWAAPPSPPAAPPANPGPAGDQKVDEARSHYERGLQFIEEENFDAALVEMERAYQIAPSYRILFNLGRIQKARNNYAAALRHFEGYLEEGKDSIAQERRTEVEKEIATLRGRVATVEVKVNMAGADIAVDDVMVGHSPLAKGLVVNPGRRKITASKPGLPSVTKVISLAALDAEVVTLQLVDPGTRVVIKESDPAPRNRAIVAWGITGVLAGAATVTGIFALTSSSDLEDQRAVRNVDPNTLDDKSGKTSGLALATDILIGTAVVGAGVATFFTVKAIKANKHERTASTPLRTMDVGFGLGQLRLAGSF